MSLDPATNGPDKFALLMQCRASMDVLVMNELQSLAKKTLVRLSMEQLKSLMFIGLNGIKKDLEYTQLTAIKTDIHGIVQKSKKKNKTNKNKEQTAIADKADNSLPMTQLIPEQVISNSICPYLLMPEICELAKVNRLLCIIAHTPSSISNLCIRHDPYRFVSNAYDDDDEYGRYTIDGNFSFLGGLDRFRNVEKLSLCKDYKSLESLCFPKTKHLTLTACDGNFPCQWLPDFPSLNSVVFEGSDHITDFLDYLALYKAAAAADDQGNSEQAEQLYFENSVNNLESIAFVNCAFQDLEMSFPFTDDTEGDIYYARYQSICKFILPLQPNQLKVLKLQASCLAASDHAEYCDEWNRQFVDLDRIKTSLRGLEGFVFSHSRTDLSDQFYLLSKAFLSNTNCFPKLESIHIHSPMLLDSLLCTIPNAYVNMASTPLKEFCVTLDPAYGVGNINDFRSKLQFMCRRPELTKCCLVIQVPRACGKEMESYYPRVCATILRNTNVKLFQLVLVIDDASDDGQPTECCSREKLVVQFSDTLLTTLRNLGKIMLSDAFVNRPLLFKFHIKSMHRTLHPKCKPKYKAFSTIIRNLIVAFLSTWPNGRIQCKLSQNHLADDTMDYMDDVWHLRDELKTLDRLLDIDVNKDEFSSNKLRHLESQENTCNREHDTAHYTISARAKSIDCDVQYDNRWNTDCEFCCNTPWL